MTHTILTFSAGIAFTLLALVAIYYAVRVKSAEKATEDAFKLAKQCMDAKEAAEDGFKKANEFFQEMKKQPNLAVFTPEQIEELGRVLGQKLFLYTSTPDVKQ